MATRILTWHLNGSSKPDERIGPSYYMEAAYTPIAVRINAEKAPSDADAEFDIRDDGVSILANRASSYVTPTIVSGTRTGEKFTSDAPKTTVVLAKGDDSEVDAEDFKEDLLIEAGSWISCYVVATGNGRNFTVHLELERVSEEDEAED